MKVDFIQKCSCLGVKISHDASKKYAITMKAAWNVKLSGFSDNNEKIRAEIA
jgi:hypothetical protein